MANIEIYPSGSEPSYVTHLTSDSDTLLPYAVLEIGTVLLLVFTRAFHGDEALTVSDSFRSPFPVCTIYV